MIQSGTTIKESLYVLNKLAKDAISFVVDESSCLLGSLTDGDVRRALIRGIQLDRPVDEIIQSHPKFIRKYDFDIKKLIEYREGNFRILPVLDEGNRVINIVNFGDFKSYLPIDAVVMAGGKGSRLLPLTLNIPKPLLKVGDKPIMEHNMNRLRLFGIDNFWISVNYLGDQIVEYFKYGEELNIEIKYVWEDKPLGTIGAVSQIKDFKHKHILVTNSDTLTTLDYEDFYLRFLESDAEMGVVTIPYKVDIPYAVLETKEKIVKSFIEKPTYTYYSNGGIYLLKKEVINSIPCGTFYNATDLMESLIQEGRKIFSYPLSGYWLDVGKPEDFIKAQEDVKQLNL